jgi:hypothetical protein
MAFLGAGRELGQVPKESKVYVPQSHNGTPTASLMARAKHHRLERRTVSLAYVVDESVLGLSWMDREVVIRGVKHEALQPIELAECLSEIQPIGRLLFHVVGIL